MEWELSEMKWILGPFFSLKLQYCWWEEKKKEAQLRINARITCKLGTQLNIGQDTTCCTLIFTDDIASTDAISGSRERERKRERWKNVRRKVYFRNKSQVLLRLRLKTIFFWWMVFKTVKHHYSDSDFLQLWLVYSDAWNTLYSIHGSVWFKCWQIREIGLVPEEITNKEATGYTSMII